MQWCPKLSAAGLSSERHVDAYFQCVKKLSRKLQQCQKLDITSQLWALAVGSYYLTKIKIMLCSKNWLIQSYQLVQVLSRVHRIYIRPETHTRVDLYSSLRIAVNMMMAIPNASCLLLRFFRTIDCLGSLWALYLILTVRDFFARHRYQLEKGSNPFHLGLFSSQG